MAKREKHTLKEGVIEAAHAIEDVGVVAEGVSESVRAIAPKARARASRAEKLAISAVTGTMAGTADIVAKVGRAAGRVADALEGTALEKEIATGRLDATQAGGAIVKIAEHVAETGQPVMLLFKGRIAAAVVPYSVYKASVPRAAAIPKPSPAALSAPNAAPKKSVASARKSPSATPKKSSAAAAVSPRKSAPPKKGR